MIEAAGGPIRDQTVSKVVCINSFVVEDFVRNTEKDYFPYFPCPVDTVF